MDAAHEVQGGEQGATPTLPAQSEHALGSSNPWIEKAGDAADMALNQPELV